MFRYTRAIGVSALVFFVGFIPAVLVVAYYLTHDQSLPSPASTIDHLGVTGVLLMIFGFSGFCFTLLLHSTGIQYGSAGATDTESSEMMADLPGHGYAREL